LAFKNLMSFSDSLTLFQHSRFYEAFVKSLYQVLYGTLWLSCQISIIMVEYALPLQPCPEFWQIYLEKKCHVLGTSEDIRTNKPCVLDYGLPNGGTTFAVWDQGHSIRII